MKRANKIGDSTDKIGDVEAVGEAAGGAAARVVDAVGRGIRPGSRGKVVVVPDVHERVPEDEESSSALNTRSRGEQHCGRDKGEKESVESSHD